MPDSRIVLERKALKALITSMDYRNQYRASLTAGFLSQTRRFIYNLCSNIMAPLTQDVLQNELTKRLNLSQQGRDRIANEYSQIINTKVLMSEAAYVLEEVGRYGRAETYVKAMQEYIGKIRRGELKKAEDELSDTVLQMRVGSGKLQLESGEVSQDIDERINNLLTVKRDFRNRCIYGLKKLDASANVGGMWPGELSVLFGRSDIGKSILALNIAHANRLMNKKVIYLSLEMDKQQVAFRYDSLLTGLNYRSAFKFGKITNEEVDRWKLAMVETGANGGELHTVGVRGECTVADIKAFLFGFNLRHGHPDLMIIDFLDMLNWNGKVFSEQHEQGLITLAIKRLAQEFKMSMLAITHKTVTAEDGSTDETLEQGSMGYSRRKINYADTVLGIYRSSTNIEDGVTTIKVVKGRDGGTGFTFHVRPMLDQMRFDEV
jgi:replicative DNA helicase